MRVGAAGSAKFQVPKTLTVLSVTSTSVDRYEAGGNGFKRGPRSYPSVKSPPYEEGLYGLRRNLR